MYNSDDLGIENISNDTLFHVINNLGNNLIYDMVNSQVILQILVSKEICTREEVEKLREIVFAKDKRIRELVNTLSSINVRYNMNKENNDLLVKAILSDPKSLTPEEKEKALKMLDPSKFK